jgi:hypothetical protein
MQRVIKAYLARLSGPFLCPPNCCNNPCNNSARYTLVISSTAAIQHIVTFRLGSTGSQMPLAISAAVILDDTLGSNKTAIELCIGPSVFSVDLNFTVSSSIRNIYLYEDSHRVALTLSSSCTSLSDCQKHAWLICIRCLESRVTMIWSIIIWFWNKVNNGNGCCERKQLSTPVVSYSGCVCCLQLHREQPRRCCCGSRSEDQ